MHIPATTKLFIQMNAFYWAPKYSLRANLENVSISKTAFISLPVVLY